jgi:CRISPR-associated protein Cas1
MPAMVTSGDTSNLEGTAARFYFPSLFGADFLRHHSRKGINSFLNYGYAIVRAALARQVVAAGLNPCFGIQHHNQLNPFCLVDDLMEPYRPLVDIIVRKIFGEADDVARELTPEDKKKLSVIIDTDFPTRAGASPLITIMQRDVWAFVRSLEQKKNLLDYEDVI